MTKQTKTPKVASQLDAAHLFAKHNLIDLCKEAIQHVETGVLPDGKMRVLRGMCLFAGAHAGQVAENIVLQEATRKIVELNTLTSNQN